MQRTSIAVVDATRARLFTYERSAEPEGVREQLTEQTDLVNPARRRTGAELFSDSGKTAGRAGDHGFGFDDHRAAHIDQMDAEFARAVIAEIERAIRTPGSQRLVLCASPRMLGTLRELGAALARDGLVIDELPRDLVKLTMPEVRDHLASYGLLPPRAARTAH